MSKSKDFKKSGKDSKVNPFKWDWEEIFLYSIPVAACLGFGVIIATGVSAVVEDSKQIKIVDKVEVLDNEFNKTVSTVANLKEFKGASATVEFDESKDPYYVNIFGSSEKTVNEYASVREYQTVKFAISEENAKALTEAIKKRDEFNKFITNVNSEFGTVADASYKSQSTAWEMKSINKSYELTKNLYEALTNAVLNAYNHNIQDISEASDMLNKISNAYRYVKPEILTEVDGYIPFGYINSEFVNCGLMVSGISNVYHDEQNQTSFFYIDTIQTKDGKNYEHHKALVRVEGILTAEEAYGKFLDGNIKTFAEITKTQTQEDTAVFMN